jgi:hypothetical protein
MKTYYPYFVAIAIVGYQIAMISLRMRCNRLLSKHYTNIDVVEKIKLRLPEGKKMLEQDLSNLAKSASHNDIKEILRLRRIMKVMTTLMFSVTILIMIIVLLS